MVKNINVRDFYIEEIIKGDKAKIKNYTNWFKTNVDARGFEYDTIEGRPVQHLVDKETLSEIIKSLKLSALVTPELKEGLITKYGVETETQITNEDIIKDPKAKLSVVLPKITHPETGQVFIEARNLHSVMGIDSRYRDWIKRDVLDDPVVIVPNVDMIHYPTMSSLVDAGLESLLTEGFIDPKVFRSTNGVVLLSELGATKVVARQKNNELSNAVLTYLAVFERSAKNVLSEDSINDIHSDMLDELKRENMENKELMAKYEAGLISLNEHVQELSSLFNDTDYGRYVTNIGIDYMYMVSCRPDLHDHIYPFHNVANHIKKHTGYNIGSRKLMKFARLINLLHDDNTPTRSSLENNYITVVPMTIETTGRLYYKPHLTGKGYLYLIKVLTTNTNPYLLDDITEIKNIDYDIIREPFSINYNNRMNQ